MDTTIYYFSGTGNSLKVARDIGTNLGNTVIIPISKLNSNENVSAQSQNIGIIFPVYIYGLPLILSRFINRLDNSFNDKYVFAAATYKSQPGGALLQLKHNLKSHGIKLSAGFNICMPGNHIVYYKPDSDNEKIHKFKLLEKRLDEIIPVIKNRNTNKIERGSIMQQLFGTHFLYKLVSKSFHTFDKQYWVNENCTGCNLCTKICTVQNISMKDNKPLWHHNCEECTACLNLCPEKAIQYRKITINKQRYKNPFVDIKDLGNFS